MPGVYWAISNLYYYGEALHFEAKRRIRNVATYLNIIEHKFIPLGRARLIVMTTVAMKASKLPSAWSFSQGGAFTAPVAIAIIGGLVKLDGSQPDHRSRAVHDYR